MRRKVLAAVVLVASLFAWITPGVAAVTTPTAGGTGSAPGNSSPAFEQLSDCLQISGRLLVVLLIDESRSLNQTDRDGARFVGLQATMRGLERLATTPVRGDAPDLEVLFTGFADGFRRYGDWTDVNPRSPDALDRALREMEGHELTLYTDYGDALEGARDEMNERAAELSDGGEGQPCKAVVWFTDGRFDIGDGTEGAVRALCADGGPSDRLRQDDVSLFTVALASGMEERDRSFLESVTVGEAGTQRCGSLASQDNGAYVEVPDPNDLQFVFCCIGAPAEITTGSGSFDLVPGLGSFLINVTTGSPEVGLELRPPLGQPVRLGPGGPVRLPVGGADVEQTWFSDQAGEIVGVLPVDDDAWVGRWEVRFLGDAPDSVAEPRWTVRLTPGLEPKLVEPDRFVIGEETSLVATVVDQAGRPASGPLLAESDVVAVVRDPVTGDQTEVEMQPTDNGRLEGRFVTPDATTASELAVALELTLDVGGQVDSTPIRRAVRIPTRLPQEWITIEPARLELGTVTGDDSVEATFHLTGGIADGCLWLDDQSTIEGPPEAGPFTLSAEPDARDDRSCLPVAARSDNEVRVTIDPDHYGLGRADGSIVFGVTSERATQTRFVAVPVAFSMRPPPCVICSVLIGIVLFVVGLALPLGLLHWLNRRGARFATPGRLMVATVPVAIAVDGTVTRSTNDVDFVDEMLTDRSTTEGTPEALLSFRDFRSLSLGGEEKVRQIRVDGSTELRAVASGSLARRALSLFGGPYGEATASGDVLFGGAPASRLQSWSGHTAQEVPLALRGTWLFVPTSGLGGASRSQTAGDSGYADLMGDAVPAAGAPAEAPAATGVLHAFAVAGEDEDQYERVGRDATLGLQDLLGVMAQLGRPSAGDADGTWLARLRRGREGSGGNQKQAREGVPPTRPPVAPGDGPVAGGEFDDLMP